MNTRFNIVTYSSQAIQLWLEELKQIPALIRAQEEIIAPLLPKIKESEEKLALVRSHIKVLKKQLSIAKTQYATQQIHQIGGLLQTSHHRYGHHHHFYGPGIFHQAVDIASQIRSLETELGQYIVEFEAPLVLALSQHNAIVNPAINKIQALEAKRKLINEDHIPNARAFLSELEKNPEQLFRMFLGTVRKQLKKYDDTHYQQKTLVRLCLSDFEDKLNSLLEDLNEEEKTKLQYENYSKHVNAESDNKVWQLKYLQLCGWLWSMRVEMEAANEALEFDQLIASLLSRRGIGFGDDLPDKMATKKGCIEQFTLLRNKYSALFNRSEEQLDYIDSSRYVKALTALRAYARKSSDRKHQLSGGLADEVEKVIARQIDENKTKPEFKHYTRVLTQAHNYVTCAYNDPDRWEIERDFANLADHVSGGPSTSKKILGAMVGILGVTILGVSCALAVPTCGISTIGIGLGCSLLAQFITAGTGIAGFGAAALGFGLFAHGMPKGVCKKMQQLDNEMEKSHHVKVGFPPALYKPAY